MSSLFQNRTLEERFFGVILFCSIPYYLFNVITLFIFDDVDPILIGIYAVLLLTSSGLLFMIYKIGTSAALINLFIFIIISAYLYYLPKTAGPTGGIGYMLQNLIVVTILLTRGKMRYVFVLILGAICFILFSGVLDFGDIINYKQLIFDYVYNLIFITIFIVYFKHNFDNEQDQLTLKNDELEKLNQELEEQTQQLQNTNEEIQAIRDNLQQKVIDRTRKLEEENEKLLEYSFINAHLVRAPIANIMGLTQLEHSNPEIEKIRKSVNEMDEVIRKIAKVLE